MFRGIILSGVTKSEGIIFWDTPPCGFLISIICITSGKFRAVEFNSFVNIIVVV